MFDRLPVIGLAGIPRQSRPSYAREFRHLTLWSIVVGAIEGNIAGIVAFKTFDASPVLTSLVWSIPVFMNTLNLFWSVVIRGRRRIPLLITLATFVTLCVCSLALTPATLAGAGWLFAAQMALTHFFFSGLTTLRSSIWNANYPSTHRGRVVGRLQTLRLLIAMTSGGAIAWLFDSDPHMYRVVYPVVALCGLLSLIPARLIRVRGEARTERERPPTEARRGLWQELAAGLRDSAEILRTDRRFARYMNAQFLLGAASFATDGLLVRAIPERLGAGYYASSFLMLQLPAAVMLVSIRFWAPLFDRVGAIHFRVYNSAAWLAVYALTTASMLLVELGGSDWLMTAVALLVLGRVAQGFSQAGGTIAWSIGHLHFSSGDRSDLYMGIHVALTGLRGMLMPIVSVLLNAWIGNVSFAVSIALATASFILFWRLSRDEVRANQPGEQTGQAIVQLRADADS